MLIGAMNHPREPVLSEIRWMAALGLDFIDLTLGPPAAASWRATMSEMPQPTSLTITGAPRDEQIISMRCKRPLKFRSPSGCNAS